jgi:hypothetical protein
MIFTLIRFPENGGVAARHGAPKACDYNFKYGPGSGKGRPIKVAMRDNAKPWTGWIIQARNHVPIQVQRSFEEPIIEYM